MTNPIGLSHEEYVAERGERDPAFREARDEMRVTMNLALALTDLREYRKMSQRMLAEKSGIRQPMINRIERGSQVPKPFTLFRLLAALNGVLTMQPDGSILVSPMESTRTGAPPGEERDPAILARQQPEALVGARSQS